VSEARWAWSSQFNGEEIRAGGYGWRYQVAAPAETRTPNLHRANKIAPRECGWKDGVSGDSAKEKACPTKIQKNPLDSDRPSHGRRLHSLRLAGRINECNGDVSPIIPAGVDSVSAVLLKPRQRCGSQLQLRRACRVPDTCLLPKLNGRHSRGMPIWSSALAVCQNPVR